MPDIYFTAAIGPCTEAVFDRKKQEISVAIAPLRVITEEQTLKVNFGCNYWRSCENPRCQYSQIAMGPKKE